MYKKFEKWLDNVLDRGLPSETVAVHFNFYEEADNYWSIQFIGANRFDEDDEDWCCDEVFTTGEYLFTWQEYTDWKKVNEKSIALINDYLNQGRYAIKLKSYKAIGAGFVDGDVEVLYKKG